MADDADPRPQLGTQARPPAPPSLRRVPCAAQPDAAQQQRNRASALRALAGLKAMVGAFGEARSGDLALLVGFGAGLAYAAQVVVLP